MRIRMYLFISCYNNYISFMVQFDFNSNVQMTQHQQIFLANKNIFEVNQSIYKESVYRLLQFFLYIFVSLNKFVFLLLFIACISLSHKIVCRLKRWAIWRCIKNYDIFKCVSFIIEKILFKKEIVGIFLFFFLCRFCRTYQSVSLKR